MGTRCKIAIAQVAPRLGDVDANLALYEEQIALARSQGAELVVFPELSLTGYFLKDMVSNVALRLDSTAVGRLRELSRRVSLVAGLVEETPDFCFYNSAVYLEDGDIRHVHRKVYLPTYGLFDEGRYLGRGDRVRSFTSKFGRLAMLVCEDLWHPSTMYIAALDRAIAVICPSSSPLRGISDSHEQDDNARYWEALNRVWAQTYSVFLVYANRVGFEDGVGFWGGSEIIGPGGELLAKGPYYEPWLVVGELNLERARERRVTAPVLRDEDIDLTINELMRIRGRAREEGEGRRQKAGAGVASSAGDSRRRRVRPRTARTRKTEKGRQRRRRSAGRR